MGLHELLESWPLWQTKQELKWMLTLSQFWRLWQLIQIIQRIRQWWSTLKYFVQINFPPNYALHRYSYFNQFYYYLYIPLCFIIVCMYMIRPIAMFLIKFHDLNKCTTSYCDVKRHLAPGLDFQSSKVHSRYIDQIYRTLTRQHF